MNVTSLGNTIYHAIKDSADACAQIRKEFASLALSIATNPSSAQVITSATVNGQTFTAQSSMTQGERLRLLRHVVACLDQNAPISSVQITTF